MTAVKVVFHIDENEKWNILLKNVSNLVRMADMRVSKIEVVANSEAVEFYRKGADSKSAGAAEKLAGAGVDFAACGNALGDHGISEKELLHFVRMVPAGVLELIERQNDGYAYIKP